MRFTNNQVILEYFFTHFSHYLQFIGAYFSTTFLHSIVHAHVQLTLQIGTHSWLAHTPG